MEEFYTRKKNSFAVWVIILSSTTVPPNTVSLVSSGYGELFFEVSLPVCIL